MIATPAFDDAEYAGRIARAQTTMTERGHDALLVVSPANQTYLTGYACVSFYAPQVLVVPASGEVAFYLRHVDASSAWLSTSLREDQVHGYPERYVQQPDVHPMDWIAGQLRDRGLGSATLAIEHDAYFHTVRAHQALLAGLPEATVVDAHDLVGWMRAIKSPAEVEAMRIAGRITTAVMTAAIEAMAPGVRQCDVAAEITAAQARGIGEHGGDWPAIPAMIRTGAATAVPHLTWSAQRLADDETTSMSLAGCYQRYHAPLARTVHLGAPPAHLERTADIVDEGMNAALAAVRMGNTCEDVEAAWRAVIRRHGLDKAGRIGYSIGLNYPPDWGEHTLSLRPGDTHPLKPGMAFHMILGMWMDGWGYELSESYVVTESGPAILADVPRGLTVKR